MTFVYDEFSVRMADDVALRTFLLHRRGEDIVKKPVLLIRTPYLCDRGLFRDLYYDAADYIDRCGYSLVVQAIRGTNGSEGNFKLLHAHEIHDGFDTVNWISRQEFCDGTIGAIGTSYNGFTALAAGVNNPVGLKVIMAGGSPTNIKTDYFFPNGTLQLFTLDYLRYMQEGGEMADPSFTNRVAELLFNETDLASFDQIVFGFPIHEWKRLARNYPRFKPSFLQERQIFNRLKDITVPTYHIAGLRFDGNSGDVVRNFMEIEKNSPFRETHKLILGYWDHTNSVPDGGEKKLTPFMLQRFKSLMDHHLKGNPSEFSNEPRVQIESHFHEEYLSGDTYPLPNLKTVEYYLDYADGQHLLSQAPRYETDKSSYRFHPLEVHSWNPADNQCLSFSGEVSEQLALSGSAEVTLYLRIDVPQTDIYLFFYKVRANGDGDILGCRPVHKIIGKHRVIKLELTVSPIHVLLEPGETLGMEISSNNFPVRARNRNTPIKTYFDAFRDAQITVLHSEKYPSKIRFPVEPGRYCL